MIRIVVERPDQPPSVRAFPGEAVTIGRASDTDWCLPFPDISRQHCRFLRRGEDFFVEGLSERSPIYVNGRRVHGATRVEAKDVVRFGMCMARLGETDAIDPARAPRSQPEPAQARPRPRDRVESTVEVGHERSATAGEIGDAPRPSRPQPSGGAAPPPVAGLSAPAAAPPEGRGAGPLTPVAALPGDMSAIVERAQRWRELDRPQSHLLRGPYLRRGREWIRHGRADLGEHGALVRQYVETSQAARRSLARKGAFAGAVLVGALLSGSWTATVLAGSIELPDATELVAAASGKCRQELLALGQERLRKAKSAGDERLGLLLSLHAHHVAEQSRCPEAAVIERDLRERLSVQAGRVLGSHAVAVVGAAISPNQLYTASVDQDGVLYLWRHAEQQPPERIDAASKVEKLAWSDDSRLLIAGDEQGKVTIWSVDRTRIRREREFSAHRSPITSIAVSRSGELMATGDRRGDVRLWMVAGSALGEQVGDYPGQLGVVHELAFDARGKRLYNRTGTGLIVWSLAASGERRLGKPERLPTDHEVTSMDVSRTGDRLLVGDASGQVYLWSVRGQKMDTPKPIYGGMEKIEQVAFVPSDQALIATSKGSLVLVNYGAKVRADDKYATRRFKGTPEAVRQLIVNPSGSRALTVHAKGRELWNLAEVDVDPVIGVGVGGGAWRTVAASARHSSIVAGGEDGRVILWDLLDTKKSGGARVLTDHGQVVDAVALSSDGATLVSGGDDGVVRIWRVADVAVTPLKTCEVKASIDHIAFHEERIAVAAGEQIFVCNADAEQPTPAELGGTYDTVTHLAFSGDGEWLVAAARGGAVVGWRGRNAAASKPDLREAVEGEVASLALSREHVAVATAGVSTGTVGVWPLSPGSGGRVMLDTVQPWTTVAFHADGGLLAAGSRSGAVRVWTLGSTQPYKPTVLDSSVTTLAFSPAAGDEAMLAIGGDRGDLALFDVVRGASRPLQKRQGAITGLSFASPDFLIASVESSAYKYFLTGTPTEPVALAGHAKPITGLAVDGRGNFAATSSMDESVRVWPLRSDGLRWLVCDRVGGDLTAEEWAEHLRGEDPVQLCRST